jgi:hypothetical protein
MARKTITHKIADDGRDKGKLFLITEMSAEQGESWAMRVLLALMASNVQIPEGFEQLGMAALAELGIRSLAGLRWEVAEPLLREMFECVQIVADPLKAFATTRALMPEDVEEISTRIKLRMEIWKLHMGFLGAVAPSLNGNLKAAADHRSRTGTSAK